MRSFLWPGYLAYLFTTRNVFGGVYFGNGIKNVDLPFYIWSHDLLFCFYPAFLFLQLLTLQLHIYLPFFARSLLYEEKCQNIEASKKAQMEEVGNGQRVKINIWIKYSDSYSTYKIFYERKQVSKPMGDLVHLPAWEICSRDANQSIKPIISRKYPTNLQSLNSFGLSVPLEALPHCPPFQLLRKIRW